jgi:CheY-like chemotaxis protein
VQAPATEYEPAARQHRGTLEGLRVLLVEDNWLVASSLKSVLELLGANVIGPAASLDDAAALANSSRYDVAVMDLDLQGELADKLICTVHWRGVPVVVVTGYELPPAIADKVLTVIPKPINAGALLTKLREVNTAINDDAETGSRRTQTSSGCKAP